jgi:hypothetical protein
VLGSLVGDAEFLNMVGGGVSPYVVHARQTMGLGETETWAKTDPRYKLAKARALGLGYGSGHKKFLWMATTLYDAGEVFDSPIKQADVDAYREYLDRINDKEQLALMSSKDVPDTEKIRLVNAWLVVEDFRRKSPKITGLWLKLGEALKNSANKGEDFELGLPNGNVLTYRKPAYSSEPGEARQVYVGLTKNGRPIREKTHGSKLCENLVQATAREVFTETMLNVHDAGYKIILHVHDEIVVEVDEDKAEVAAKDIECLMGLPIAWAPELPVAAEAQISKVYTK